MVSVSKKGKITGKKKGKASITVTVVQNGKTYKKKLTIKVK
ncbi:MAG: Ig-like domain-containing protein [Eubacterium sp.]|nr:Ig-like domain-containing protein [Eubacterium sp.]